MPFTEERAERLKALFELIEQNGDCAAHELTYQVVPYLKETDELVNAQLASESPYDEVTLLDSATIMRLLAPPCAFRASARQNKKPSGE